MAATTEGIHIMLAQRVCERAFPRNGGRDGALASRRIGDAEMAPQARLRKWLPGFIVHCAMLALVLPFALPARASDPIVESYTPKSSSPPAVIGPKFIPVPGIAAGWASGEIASYYNPVGEPVSLRGRVEGIIAAASAEWSSHCNVHFRYQGLSTAVPRTPDGQTVIGWNAGQPHSGITFLQTSADRLVEAGIEMNPNVTDTPGFASEVLVHEIGHLLGLSHSDIQGAVMSGPPFTSYSYATHLTDRHLGLPGALRQSGLRVAAAAATLQHR
jgi:hypothetical protein